MFCKKKKKMTDNTIRVTGNDLFELAASGQIVHCDKLFRTSHDFKTDEQLGFHSHKVALFDGFRIQEWQSLFNRDIVVEMEYSLNSVLNLQFMQQGILQYSAQNKTINQKGGENYMWAIPQFLSGSASYRKSALYSSFEIGIEDRYLEKLTNRYPDLLTGLYRRYQKGNFWEFNGKEPHATSCHMNAVISQIKNAQLMGNIAEMYVEAKVLELLTLLLYQEEYPERSLCNQWCCKRKRDIDKIHEARRILLSEFKTPPTIIELSRKVGINDYKLKSGFKEVFNQTVYECLFEYKMELARKMLLDTDKPIAEIADGCGYEYPSHFTNAFKRKYGISPKMYRTLHS